MICFHCKQPINAKESRIYVPYRRGTRFLKRIWCKKCGDNDKIIDAEYPEDKA